MCFSLRFFFFKQKTAYEMRISDWSSDVCSSDLEIPIISARAIALLDAISQLEWRSHLDALGTDIDHLHHDAGAVGILHEPYIERRRRMIGAPGCGVGEHRGWLVDERSWIELRHCSISETGTASQ